MARPRLRPKTTKTAVQKNSILRDVRSRSKNNTLSILKLDQNFARPFYFSETSYHRLSIPKKAVDWNYAKADEKHIEMSRICTETRPFISSNSYCYKDHFVISNWPCFDVDRHVISRSTTVRHPFMYTTLEISGFLDVMTAAIVGISHSMVSSAAPLGLSKVHCIRHMLEI